SGVDVADGKWHYLAMTFDGSRVRLHVDARLVKEAAVSRRGTKIVPGLLYMGSYPPQKIGCDGVLDEVRISGALRAIDKVPQGPFTADGQTAGLWHFDGE